MDTASLRILLVEDNPGDARLVEWYLSKPGADTFQVVRAERLTDALRELAATRFDLVLLDLSLPDSAGLDTVRSTRRAAGITPIVVLTGLDDEEAALDALRNGAQDYLVKGKFDSHELTRSLRYAIERERIEQAQRQTKEALEAIIAASPAAVLSLDTEGRVLTWNESAGHIFGWTAAEAIGRIPPFLPAGSEAEFDSLLKRVLAGEPVPEFESQRRRKDGALIDVSLSARRIRGTDGSASGVVVVLADITRRKQAEAELAAEAERTGILFEHAPDAYYLTDFHGTFLDGNRAAEQILGYGREELIGENLLKLDLLPMSTVTKVAGLLVRNAFGQGTGPDEIVMRRRDGTLVAAELYTHVVTIHGNKVVLNSMRDVTERKRIERTLRERVRELDCLYGVARLVEKPGISLEELLKGVVMTLAHALQRAAVAGARVRFDEREYRTPNWEDTKLRIQEPLIVDGVEAGTVELGYRPDVGESELSFLPEEHNLLFAVATQLGQILERMHAAAARRESEERYRDLFENATDLIQSVGSDGKYIFTNRHWRETLGYSEAEVARLTMFDVLAPECHDHCRQLFGELMHGGQVECVDTTFLAKDGRRVFVEGNLSCSLKDGRSVATRGFFRDITERRLAETALRAVQQRREQLENIVSRSPAVAFLWRTDERLTVDFVSSNVSQLGYEPEEFLSGRLHYTDIVHYEDRDHAIAEAARHVAAGKSEFVQEYRVLTKANELRWVEDHTWVPRDSDGSVTHHQGIIVDITERKQAEAALAESELKFRTVFESSNDAMMLLNSEKFLDCNEATLRAFGYPTRDEFLGRHPGEVSPPLQADGRESHSAADEHIAAAFRDGRDFFEWLHQRADGAVFPADVLLTPLHYHGRRVLQATVRDITARKAAEAEIVQKNIELARLNAVKNQFLGMAAHDLRNPLTVVNTASSFLLDEAGKALPEAKKSDFIRRINANGEFMLKLINDLLDVAKIESGRLDLELTTGNLCGLIEENLTMNRMLAEKKSIRLDYAPECGVPPLRFDRGKVEQVLNNLISNALKFSAPGTAVMVRASRVGDSIVVSVRDQGQGIPAEELDKLFKPFGKTTVRSTAGEKSTGLGLAICRKIVEGHHGRIWAESEVGGGSTFSFSLPVASDHLQASDLQSQARKNDSTTV